MNPNTADFIVKCKRICKHLKEIKAEKDREADE